MNGWFLTHIIINFLGLGIHLAKHGEEREGTYNFWIALFSTLISLGFVYMAIKTGF